MGLTSINKAKKWAAFFICCVIPGSVMLALFPMGNVIFLLGGFIVSSLLCVILGSILISNPFTQVHEGDGLIVFNVSSPGIITPFIVKYNNVDSSLDGKLGTTNISSFFSRKLVHHLNFPKFGKYNKKISETGKTEYVFTLPVEQENQHAFVLNKYTCFLFNSKLNSFLNKETLSSFEEKMFVTHNIFDLNKAVIKLEQDIRPFASYVMENLKPKGNIWTNPIMIIGIVVLIIIIMFFVGPPVLEALTKSGGSFIPQSAVLPQQAVTPNTLPLIPSN